MNQSEYEPTTWYDPRLERRVSPTHGHGLFATAPIRTGETVMNWGGDVYTEAELATVKLEGAWSYSFIDEGLLMFAPAENLDYFINHSCDPNIWVGAGLALIARRDIALDEEIVGDYALWESEAQIVVESCQCGTALCRSRITGNDWQRSELQQRYAQHFLPFLNRRIAALQRQQPT